MAIKLPDGLPALVFIEWIDAVAESGWEPDTKAACHTAYTVGFIIDENEDAICIASTWSLEESNSRMHIPKLWIKQRKSL